MSLLAMNITLVYSPAARQVCQWQLQVPGGTSIEQVVLQSGALEQFVEIDLPDLTLGVWGKTCSLDQVLKDQDRIEIYRPLRVDPKVARRERFARQGAKRAGLFASKRVDAKAGYGG